MHQVNAARGISLINVGRSVLMQHFIAKNDLSLLSSSFTWIREKL
jgi:hypothetical protein